MHFRFVLLLLCAGVWLLSAAPTCAQVLNATVTLQQTRNSNGQTVWNYSVMNNEPSTSANNVTAFYLPVNAPVFGIQAPAGWAADTSDPTFVQWYNAEDYPYPDDVRPQSALPGFAFTSDTPDGATVTFEINSYVGGPAALGNVLSPTVAPVPEPGALPILGLGAATLGLLILMRRRVPTPDA